MVRDATFSALYDTFSLPNICCTFCLYFLWAMMVTSVMPWLMVKKSSLPLSGRVAIVTGAAKGNVLAIAKGFLQNGAIVFFIDIDRDHLNNVKISLNSRDAYFIDFNVADFKNIEKILLAKQGIFEEDLKAKVSGLPRTRPFIEAIKINADYRS